MAWKILKVLMAFIFGGFGILLIGAMVIGGIQEANRTPEERAARTAEDAASQARLDALFARRAAEANKQAEAEAAMTPAERLAVTMKKDLDARIVAQDQNHVENANRAAVNEQMEIIETLGGNIGKMACVNGMPVGQIVGIDNNPWSYIIKAAANNMTVRIDRVAPC